MSTIGFIAITILFLYVVLILFLILGFYRVGEETYKTNDPVNSFSILIPFRDEEENLEELIESLSKLEYPYTKFEIIFIDDHSSDNSYELIRTLVRYTKLKTKLIKVDDEKIGKKNAILKGVEESIFDYIITTDADCVIPPLWLKIFDQSLIENNSKMIAGPIKFKSFGTGFFENFQTSDLAAMMGTTIGGFGLRKPFMCNGANLLYSKEAFYEVGAYDGNLDSISGDDVFLMEKFTKEYPNQVDYVKSDYSIVSTNTVSNVKDLIEQRVRWASKSANYNSLYIKALGMFIGLANLTLLFMIFYMLFYPNLQIMFFIMIKILVDLWMIRISSNFLSQKHELKWYPLIALSYPLYVIVVAALSQTKMFIWKGRKFKKNNPKPF